MIVEAMCIADAFDNGVIKGGKVLAEPRRYYRGKVEDFDTDNTRLNSLTDARGNWVFQYPGHTGVSQAWLEENSRTAKKTGVAEAEVKVAAEAPAAPVTKPPKPVFLCDDCGKECKTAHTLKAHQKSHKNKEQAAA